PDRGEASVAPQQPILEKFIPEFRRNRLLVAVVPLPRPQPLHELRRPAQDRLCRALVTRKELQEARSQQARGPPAVRAGGHRPGEIKLGPAVWTAQPLQ